MGKPYSEDLRMRVMAAIDNGERLCRVAKQFDVFEKTLYLWRRQRLARGHIRPITQYQKGHSHKITDLEGFKRFAISHASMTALEMAQACGGVGATTIKKALAAIGFTRKKRRMAITIAAKKSEHNMLIYYQRYPTANASI
jgi:transposase